jgi:hypothetical protein
MDFGSNEKPNTVEGERERLREVGDQRSEIRDRGTGGLEYWIYRFWSNEKTRHG